MGRAAGEFAFLAFAFFFPELLFSTGALMGTLELPEDEAYGARHGLGNIPQASLELKPAYEKYDALKRFDIEPAIAPEPPGCQCGRVLCGLIEPPECPLFAKTCTPDDPVGPCMVSHEGSCAAWYKYSQH